MVDRVTSFIDEHSSDDVKVRSSRKSYRIFYFLIFRTILTLDRPLTLKIIIIIQNQKISKKSITKRSE